MRRGFTLIELMVVILIILLVSAVVLPQMLPALAHRQVSEAGRILQAGLVQARAKAVGANAPRGIRLLPDPTYANSASILAYNRWVPIEPGPDYSAGQVVIWPLPVNDPNNANGDQTLGAGALPFSNLPGLAPPYPNLLGGAYPYMPTFSGSGFAGQTLMVEQAPFINNSPMFGVNNPTSWFWTARIGDKIQIGNEGRQYTIVGPCTINPVTMNGQNPELFVNDGPPGNTPLLQRTYTYLDASNTQQSVSPSVEYLFVVNSTDDDGDGWTDSGWNGIDDSTTVNGSSAQAVSFNFNKTADDLSEWENEAWLGSQQAMQSYPNQFVNRVSGPYTAYQSALTLTSVNLAPPVDYSILRRPVVSPGAQETALPSGVVIDATSWNATVERSRLPIDSQSKYCDILLNVSGQIVLTTQYSTPASFGESASFFHFWLAERADVHEITDVWGPGNANPDAPASKFMLPIPAQFTTGLGQQPTLFLTGERMLLTLFTRTGAVSTNSIESFDAADVNRPFYDAQVGARESK